MIVAAHQPHYLPWLGYLDKLAGADLFVVMDDLQYEAQNFINRQRVKLATGPHWLVVPLVRGAQTDRICDKRIDNTGRGGRHHWQHRHWRTLVVNYSMTPGWDRIAPALEDVYTRRWDFLLDLDLHVLDLARRWFGITRPIVRASSLELRGIKTDRIIAMCHAVGARTYLTGKGGSAGYLDVDALARAGIATVWQSFAHPTYPQRYPGVGFSSHLGFLDFLCNVGSPSTKELVHESSAR
ncbi:MAG: WbqC family protein [Kofleriaceae bacterium]